MKRRSVNRQIRYVPRPDATPEQELDALAAVYWFLLGRHAKRGRRTRAAGTNGGEDSRREEKHVSRDRTTP